MTSKIFSQVEAFIAKAAPDAEAALVSDFDKAIADAKAAFAPVADAAVVAAVALITSKYALNAPFSAPEIAFLEGIIAKLTALIPST